MVHNCGPPTVLVVCYTGNESTLSGLTARECCVGLGVSFLSSENNSFPCVGMYYLPY